LQLQKGHVIILTEAALNQQQGVIQQMPTLKELRERAILSQGELANAIGVHRRTIIAWELGEFKPRPKQQRLLIEIFRCTPEEFLAALRETKEAREGRKREAEEKRPAA
jgi:DNA-binding XRE family transcriptional regulator